MNIAAAFQAAFLKLAQEFTPGMRMTIYGDVFFI